MRRTVKIKNIVLRAVAAVLVLSMLCVGICSCASKVNSPILECEGEKIPLSMYEFLLSRMKGELSRNKYDVNPTSDFWTEKHLNSEMTNEEYYNASILDVCNNYLVALMLFKEEGLKLSDSTYDDIEEKIEGHMAADYADSEEKFEAILQKYGVKTADELRLIYEIEAKYQAALNYIYGAGGEQIGDTVKEEYYKENYYRFKQILVSNFYYEYEADEHGNTIYFDPDSKKPVYDAENGKPGYDENNNYIKDDYGVTVYYDDDGNIVYDTERGEPSFKTDSDGKAITHKYSDSEMAEREAEMQEMLRGLTDGNFSAFESNMPSWEMYEGESDYYPDGYYLSALESAGYEDYLSDTLAQLKVMQVGEIRVVESEYGYHIIMKYELDRGKYSDSKYAEWFSSFESSIRTKLFLEKCEKYYPKIKVNEEILKTAKSIKSIGTNLYY